MIAVPFKVISFLANCRWKYVICYGQVRTQTASVSGEIALSNWSEVLRDIWAAAWDFQQVGMCD